MTNCGQWKITWSELMSMSASVATKVRNRVPGGTGISMPKYPSRKWNSAAGSKVARPGIPMPTSPQRAGRNAPCKPSSGTVSDDIRLARPDRLQIKSDARICVHIELRMRAGQRGGQVVDKRRARQRHRPLCRRQRFDRFRQKSRGPCGRTSWAGQSCARPNRVARTVPAVRNKDAVDKLHCGDFMVVSRADNVGANLHLGGIAGERIETADPIFRSCRHHRPRCPPSRGF